MREIALRHADTDGDVAACFPVMVLLRPHLHNAAELVARVTRQRAEGYRILAALRDRDSVALAGYPIHGRVIYVDDLVCR